MAIRQRFTLLLVYIEKIRTPPVIHCPITERFLLLIQTELIFILILTPQITVKNSNKLKVAGKLNLRWLETVFSTFQASQFDGSL